MKNIFSKIITKSSQKGITLIALIVTVIVHLISYDKKVEYSI